MGVPRSMVLRARMKEPSQATKVGYASDRAARLQRMTIGTACISGYTAVTAPRSMLTRARFRPLVQKSVMLLIVLPFFGELQLSSALRAFQKVHMPSPHFDIPCAGTGQVCWELNRQKY